MTEAFAEDSAEVARVAEAAATSDVDRQQLRCFSHDSCGILEAPMANVFGQRRPVLQSWPIATSSRSCEESAR